MATISFEERSSFSAAPMPRDQESARDGDLLDRFIRVNDSEAFEEIVRRHGRMVLGVCRRVLDNPHDAEDCFQAVFMVLVRKAASVQPRDMVGNWLYGVAYRTALEAKKMAARRRNHEKKKSAMPRNQPSSECWHDLRPLLDLELTKLPDKYRAVLVSCDLEGQTRKDVAHALGVPEGTVASRLARARVMLAKRLARRNFCISAGALAILLTKHGRAAEVPLALCEATAQAASGLASGKPLVDLVSGPAAALTDAVARSLGWTRFAIASAVFTAVAILGIGVTALLPSVFAAKPIEPAFGHAALKKDKPRQAIDCVLQTVDLASRTVLATLSSDEDGGTQMQAFRVEPDTRIVLEGKDGRLQDLRAGMCVLLEWNARADGARQAQCIEVVGEAIEGIVHALNETSVTIRGDRGEKTFERTDAVFVDGKKARFDDLKRMMKVTIKAPVGKNKTTSIKAAGPKVAARVKAIDVAKRKLSLDLVAAHMAADGLAVAPEAEVIVAGKRGRLADVKTGMHVTVQMSAETEGGYVVRIVAALLGRKIDN